MTGLPRRAQEVSVLLTLLAVACGQEPRRQEAGQDIPAAKSGVRLLVTDETGGNLVIVDPEAGQVVDRISVGKRPRGVLLSPDGRHALVALSGSPIAGPGVDESTLPPPDRAADGIGVVNIAERKLVRTLPSGQDPETFDLSTDGQTVYVSNEETAEMSVLDIKTATIRGRVKIAEEPEGVTVRPDGGIVYVTCEGDNAVYAVNTSTLAVVARIETGARPRSVVFTRDGTTAFVTAENGGVITVVDATAHKVSGTIPIAPSADAPTPPRPMGGTLSPDGQQLYVSLGRARSVAIIDVAERRVIRMIEDVGTRPWGIAISADGRKLYTANGPSEDVSVIDVASGKVERRVSVGGSPWGVIVVNGIG
jgi:YVTN family beta-propeller protein